GGPGDDHEAEAAGQEVRGPATRRSCDQHGAVTEPREERNRLERVQLPAVSALTHETDRKADGQERPRDHDRAPPERLERLERRQPEAEDVRRAPLQPTLLPEVEAGQRRGQGEAGERSEDEADVEREEERSRIRV